jgi:hypothetical protein
MKAYMYFSLVGWMKYIASMMGNGCLRLYMSSTTTKRNMKSHTIQEIELVVKNTGVS